MRYSKEHKEQIRGDLLSAAGGHAKRHGFAASGVDALAASAGVTSGALYKHFESKDQLFAEVIRTELQHTKERFEHLQPGDAEALLKAIAAYVSLPHVRMPEIGCPLPSLTTEVARAPQEVRTVFEVGMVELKDTVAGVVGSSDKAWALIAQNVGAVMLARAMHDEAVQKSLLRAVKDASGELLRSANEDKGA